jgi:type I restriction enzyme S subunit
MDTVGIGMIGSGYMALTYSESIMRHMTGARLVAIAGGSRAPKLAAEYEVDVEESVEALLARVQATRKRLARVPLILKRFRQAILTAAFSGVLTADWRDDTERADKKVVVRPRDVALEFPDFPDEWECARSADIVEPGTVISYGIVLPGPNLPNGVPYIRGQDINDDGRIQVEQLWKTTPMIAAKHMRSELREGDVLLCVIRHLRVAIVPAGIDGANLTQGTVRLRPSSKVNNRFLAHYLKSPIAQTWMKDRYIGMAMPRINVSHAREIPVPLPALTEQQEIARRIDALFKRADAIERRVAAATARADKLTQAILAKAFRGELVPTEAELARQEGRDYETAEQLLERAKSECPQIIKAPRSAINNGRQPNRSRQ